MKSIAAAAALVLAGAACGDTANSALVDGGCVGDTCSNDATATVDAPPVRCVGELPAQWNTGTNCPEPEFQTVRYDRDTYILRQSLCTSFEAPFLHLWFGDNMALLEDTGDGGVDVVGAVDAAMDQWMAESGRPEPPLLVVNSHGHGDHTAGNTAFDARPNTTVVGATVGEVTAFFGIANFTEDSARIDLGGRTIELVGIPGHQAAHIALFDASRGLLLTGDSLYPGRLFVSDFATFRDSIDRLVAFTEERQVCHVLGTHIELSNVPGEEFPVGSTSHPNERALELSRSHLVELSAALAAMANDPQRETHDDFVIVP